MSSLRDRRTATVIAGAAFLASITAGIVLFTQTAPAPRGGNGVSGASVTLAAGTLVVPTLLTVAIVMLLAPRMRGGRPVRIMAIVLMSLGLVASGLAALAWSAGFAIADAGMPQTLFTGLPVPLLAAALVLVASATATIWAAVWAADPRHPLRRPVSRVPVIVVVSLLVSPAVVVAAIVPTGTMLASCGVFILGLVLVLRGNAEAEQVRSALASPASHERPPAFPVSDGTFSPDITTLIPVIPVIGVGPVRPAGYARRTARVPGTGPARSFDRDPDARRAAARRATLLAWGSLATTVAVWGGGLAASIRLTGQPAATDVIGASMGAGQLAAIPLLLCFTVVLAARMPDSGRALWTAAAAASAVIGACASALAVSGGEDGVLMFSLMPVTGIAVGAWVATAAWPRLELPAVARIASAVVVAIAGAFLYSGFVTMIGGITLIVASVLMGAWGAKAAALGGPKPTGIRVSTVS